MVAWPPPWMSRTARQPPPDFWTTQYWPTLALAENSAPGLIVDCHASAPLESMDAIATLAELLLTKGYCTDAPEGKQGEPMAPQDSSPAPLALTCSTAGCVCLGVGFGVGLRLGFGEDFGVDLVDDATDPGAVDCVWVIAF